MNGSRVLTYCSDPFSLYDLILRYFACILYISQIDTMEDYLDLRAPQWVDFTETSSPIRMQDFFEKTHMIHERIEDLCDPASENIENIQPMSQMDVTCASTQAQTDLDIIKSTPIKVVSLKHRNNKEVVAETTYDQVLSDAMRKLELCKKSFKTRKALNKTIQESNVFKTPNISKIAKSSRSVGYHSIPKKHIQSGQDSMPKSIKVNKNISMPGNDTSASVKKTSVNHALFKQDENHAENDTSKRPNDLIDSKDKKEKQDKEDSKDCNEKNDEEYKKDIMKCNETDNKEHNEEDDKELQDELKESTDDNTEINKEETSQDDVDATFEKGNRTQSSNKHTVLTWYNHRRSLQKRRMSANKKYISLAEAVSRFQNETPERFRTRSSKASNVSMPLLKSMQGRLKPTIPISPALVSKNRTRPVTVLSREEREKLEMEELKKHPIKANPIRPNVLRGSRIMTRAINVAKKSMKENAQVSMIQSSEKACVTNSLQPKSPLSHRDKMSSGSKNVVKVLVTDSSGIIVEHEEIAFFGVPKDTGVAKNVTRIVPFSFEARNKDLQIKKEQRLKSLQEASKTKAEFHARPVPNFSKLPTPVKQQQQNTKKSILPCPFSFDNRDKKVSERKEQLVKQVLEEDKRARVFRANPAPVFKPVMVRGRSKECLLAKDKNTKMISEQVEDQENREPNVDFSKTKRENIQKTRDAVCIVDKQKVPLKVCPPKLNTDKRAKERYEFNEKMKMKEIEEDAKRQEAEKKKLESEKVMKAKLRKLAEVKAKPMPIYKPPIIIKATKQLTNPQSPAFASKLKSKQT